MVDSLKYITRAIVTQNQIGVVNIALNYRLKAIITLPNGKAIQGCK